MPSVLSRTYSPGPGLMIDSSWCKPGRNQQSRSGKQSQEEPTFFATLSFTSTSRVSLGSEEGHAQPELRPDWLVDPQVDALDTVSGPHRGMLVSARQTRPGPEGSCLRHAAR